MSENHTTLNNMIFSDGVIKWIEFSDGLLKLEYEDYCHSSWILSFSGNISATEMGSVGYSVFKSRISNNGSRQRFEAMDDDLKVVLDISFSECRIEPVKSL